MPVKEKQAWQMPMSTSYLCLHHTAFHGSQIAIYTWWWMLDSE